MVIDISKLMEDCGKIISEFANKYKEALVIICRFMHLASPT